MARRPRGSITNSFVHVTSIGNRGQSIYLHEPDYEFFLETLRECASQCLARVHAYCLMTTHFHLLAEVGEISLSRYMHRLLGRFAQHINRRYGFHGHVFGGRFWGRVCADDADVLSVLQYIHLNPVRAGIVGDPELYRWSSHMAYLGLAFEPWVATDLLRFFSDDRSHAMECYARFITEWQIRGSARRPDADLVGTH